MSKPEALISMWITKDRLIQGLREMTIHARDFQPGPWSIGDAEDLEAAAQLIRRTIAAAAKQRLTEPAPAGTDGAETEGQA